MAPLSKYHRQIVETRAVARAKWEPTQILFPAQLAAKNDNARLKIIDGPRRIGKSKFAAVCLIDTALSIPRAKCLFLALTRDDARDIVWQELVELNEDFALGAKQNDARLELVFPNSSRIRLGGAKDRQQAERRRGRFYDLVIIDEAQSFPSHLRDLVESILKPSLLGKNRRGKIIMMGTPGDMPGVGYWEERVDDARGGKLWQLHSWDTYDNTWLGTPDEITAFLKEMADSMEDEGGEESPRYLREFRGKRVPPRNMDKPYIYDAAKQHFIAPIIEQLETKTERLTRWGLPLGGTWRYVFGIDIGHSDASAIAVWGVTDLAPGVVWLVEEFIAVKMLPDTLWAKINERRSVYHPLQMAVDEGALGKMIAEQWRTPPYSLPVVAAEKLAPEVQADFLSAAMSRSAVKISKFSRMAADMAVVRWDPDKLKLNKRVEAKKPHSDIIPAGRYGFKRAHAEAVALRLPAVARTLAETEAAELAAERKAGEERARHGDQPRRGRRAIDAFRR